jgi:hypothetical protein
MTAKQLAIPTNPYERLARAADELVTEVGYYMLKVSRLLGEETPGTHSLDEALAEVTRILYRDDEAA